MHNPIVRVLAHRRCQDDKLGDVRSDVHSVLSDSTEKYDRGRKADHYRQITSLMELILLAQDRPHVERFSRQLSGDWLFHEEKELTALLDLPSMGICVLLAELYRNVKFGSIASD